MEGRNKQQLHAATLTDGSLIYIERISDTLHVVNRAHVQHEICFIAILRPRLTAMSFNKNAENSIYHASFVLQGGVSGNATNHVMLRCRAPHDAVLHPKLTTRGIFQLACTFFANFKAMLLYRFSGRPSSKRCRLSGNEGLFCHQLPVLARTSIR